ncbi:hypothetical protein JK176_11925 [Gluconobacter sp. Dm-73]|uniref:hypothetical protein n=1 Tax=Gluconobacter sp. Dm-73 TaxID=2799802 RepID=UPI001B8D4747|nr:hypothetical protein [Gluconobacter sp. Dm-73]MBS1075592.1 hypothetical protein [Gluconobacter sp. Dm-73]
MSEQTDKAIKAMAAAIGMMSFEDRAETIARLLAIEGFAHCQSPEQACRYIEIISREAGKRLMEDWGAATRSFNSRDCAGEA